MHVKIRNKQIEGGIGWTHTGDGVQDQLIGLKRPWDMVLLQQPRWVHGLNTSPTLKDITEDTLTVVDSETLQIPTTVFKNLIMTTSTSMVVPMRAHEFGDK
ncbi:hypothetical protein BHE74_00037307 [Ensete ventricosum]|nr:hypothetical protein BHE74_00037307 [Ensete ventricosum]